MPAVDVCDPPAAWSLCGSSMRSPSDLEAVVVRFNSSQWGPTTCHKSNWRERQHPRRWLSVNLSQKPANRPPLRTMCRASYRAKHAARLGDPLREACGRVAENLPHEVV